MKQKTQMFLASTPLTALVVVFGIGHYSLIAAAVLVVIILVVDAYVIFELEG